MRPCRVQARRAILRGVGKGEASLGAERAAWPSFLRGRSSAETLERLSQGDPLRLREISARRLREVWVLLDPDRVYFRALGVCADAAPNEDAPQDLSKWTHMKIDLAIEQLVRADRDAENASPGLVSGDVGEFPLLTECLMMEPGLVRPASVAFNALHTLPRRAFFELIVEGRELGDCIEQGPWDEDGLYQAIQAALATLGLDVRPPPPEAVQQGKP